MIITRQELVSLNSEKCIDYTVDERQYTQFPYLRALRNVMATICFRYDALDELKVHVRAEGKMVCPCAVTLEDVEVPFSLDEEELLTFREEDLRSEELDAFYMEEAVDVEDILLAFVLPIVPIKVVKEGEIEYPSGDGWKVMTEAEFTESRKEKRDPRWAKLMDLEMDKEEQ